MNEALKIRSDQIPLFPQALCREVDPEIFFPEKGGSTKDAKKVCSNCLEKSACLEDALVKGDRFGIRGGMSERDRRRRRGLDQSSARCLHRDGNSVSQIAHNLKLSEIYVEELLRKERGYE